MSKMNEIRSEVEKIKESIECERRKLDEIILSGNAEEIYRQNIKVDQLIEQYILMKKFKISNDDEMKKIKKGWNI